MVGRRPRRGQLIRATDIGTRGIGKRGIGSTSVASPLDVHPVVRKLPLVVAACTSHQLGSARPVRSVFDARLQLVRNAAKQRKLYYFFLPILCVARRRLKRRRKHLEDSVPPGLDLFPHALANLKNICAPPLVSGLSSLRFVA